MSSALGGMKVIRYFVLVMAVVCSLAYGCKGPDNTQGRSVSHPREPGGTEVLKVCTERPQSYTSSVESQLKAVLPLLGKSGVEAEGTVKAFLDQQPRGTQSGEDRNNYLFYICQMANNGNWDSATTERLINAWGGRDSEERARKPKVKIRYNGLSHKELQEKFPLPLALEPTRTAILKFVVANEGNGPALNPMVLITVFPNDVSVDRPGGEVHQTKRDHTRYQTKAVTINPMEITGTEYEFLAEVKVPEKIENVNLLFRIFGDNLPHEDLVLYFRVINHEERSRS